MTAIVNYKGSVLELEEGDVILYRTEFKWNKPISWLASIIRTVTGVKYNHAATVVYTEGFWMKAESNEKGVRLSRLQRFIGRPHSKIIILRKNRVTKNFRAHVLSLLGNPYDVLSLVWWQLLYRTVKKWMGPTSGLISLEKMVCTDYVAYCHDLDNFWTYSAKEFLENPDFSVVYEEESLS